MLSPPHLSIYQVTSHSTYSSSLLQSSQLASLLPSFLKSSSATPLAALPFRASPHMVGRLLTPEKGESLEPNLHCTCQVLYAFLIAETPGGLVGTCSAILGFCFWLLLPSPAVLSLPPHPFPPDPIGSSSLTFHSYTDDIQMCISIPISSCQ